MTLILAEMKKGGKDYGRVEEGTYPARIAQVVDFGIQPQTDWQTKEPVDSKPRAMITWEFPTSRIELENDEGTTSMPRWQGKEYTVSTSEMSNLMKLIGTLAPKARGVDELLNMPCMVQIGSTSGGNAKVLQVLPAMDGIDVAPLENESVYFDFDHPEEALFKALPPWQRRKVLEAENYDGFADGWTEEEAEGDY